MKSLLAWLGIGRDDETAAAEGETETVRKIVRRLESLEPERARYIGAFAYVLGRVANADLEISAAESKAMEEIVERFGDLPRAQAILVVEIAKSQNRLFGGTENYLVTRELQRIASREQCEELLHCLFAVSAADGSISSSEEGQILQVAEELGFSREAYVEVRSRYNEKRSVIQRIRDRGS